MTSTRPPARPRLGLAFASLLRADLAVLSRSWRLQFLNLGLPLLMLVVFRSGQQSRVLSADTAATLVGTAIITGPMAAGVFGYPLALARDWESGVLRRLRVTLAPNWTILASRLVLHAAVIIAVALVAAGLGALIFKLPLNAAAYGSLIPSAILAGAVFLSIGQALVGLLASAAQINVVGRLVFMTLLFVGVLGLSGGVGTTIKNVAKWTPAGSTQRLFHTVLAHAGWTITDTGTTLACLGYVLIFCVLGIRYFRWDEH